MCFITPAHCVVHCVIASLRWHINMWYCDKRPLWIWLQVQRSKMIFWLATLCLILWLSLCFVLNAHCTIVWQTAEESTCLLKENTCYSLAVSSMEHVQCYQLVCRVQLSLYSYTERAILWRSKWWRYQVVTLPSGDATKWWRYQVVTQNLLYTPSIANPCLNAIFALRAKIAWDGKKLFSRLG